MDTLDSGRVRPDNHLDVNGTMVRFDDDLIETREALNGAGFTPASEHVAILIEKGRTHLFLGEDKIRLSDHPHAALRVFPSGESFSFTVNEIGQIWGTDIMETEEFHSIWSPPSGHEWVLERENEPDVVLTASGTLSLGPKGVEHIVSRPKHGAGKLLVTVLTTSGIFPAEGALKVKDSELISSVLEKAARKLGLTETTDWVASVAGTDVFISQTFAQAGLSGTIELDWMPLEGGGGDA